MATVGVAMGDVCLQRMRALDVVVRVQSILFWIPRPHGLHHELGQMLHRQLPRDRQLPPRAMRAPLAGNTHRSSSSTADDDDEAAAEDAAAPQRRRVRCSAPRCTSRSRAVPGSSAARVVAQHSISSVRPGVPPVGPHVELLSRRGRCSRALWQQHLERRALLGERRSRWFGGGLRRQQGQGHVVRLARARGRPSAAAGSRVACAESAFCDTATPTQGAAPGRGSASGRATPAEGHLRKQ